MRRLVMAMRRFRVGESGSAAPAPVLTRVRRGGLALSRCPYGIVAAEAVSHDVGAVV